jgi:hypothetical protein
MLLSHSLWRPAERDVSDKANADTGLPGLEDSPVEICEYSHLLAFTSSCLKKNHVVEMDRTVKLVHRASPNHVWSLSDFGPDTLSTLYRTLSTVPSCCGSSPWLLRPIVWHCGYYPLFPSDIRCGR